ncbi:MAG: group III truncated hemoglobin [Verrucomicrobia bacterium]|nr:group III truncated hemoglobin [Verrucomicrobiota bacterium]
MSLHDSATLSVPSLYDRLGGHEGILALIQPFYADLRQHAILGPIFNARIQDWPAHLAKITEFWARQTGGPSRYGGGFGAAHLRLGIGPEHFDHWLSLWAFNCRRQLPPREADEMRVLAELFGERLRSLVTNRGWTSFGLPQ